MGVVAHLVGRSVPLHLHGPVLGLLGVCEPSEPGHVGVVLVVQVMSCLEVIIQADPGLTYGL